MRLIDADELRAEFKTPTDWFDSKQVLTHVTGIWATIDNAPTIEPERKTGKWIHHKPFDCEHHNCNTCIECSCCGTWFGADSYAQTNYCPNCGAYMRGEGGQE